METRILQMYGSDAGQPPRSLYTKGLSPLCDIYIYTCTTTICIGLCIGSVLYREVGIIQSVLFADKPTPLAMVRPFTWLSYTYPALSLTAIVLEHQGGGSCNDNLSIMDKMIHPNVSTV